MGLGYAALQPFEQTRDRLAFLAKMLPAWFTQGSLVGLLTCVAICWLLYRNARSVSDEAGERH
jgi:hypothetical protein